MKIPLSLILSVLLSVVGLSACEDKAEQAPIVTQPKAIEPIKTGVENPAYKWVKDDYTLADLTIKNLIHSINLSLQSKGLLDNKQRSCIAKIDTNVARLAMQNFLIGEFTPTEFAQLNEFFKDKNAVKYAEYSSEQAVIASGVELARVKEPLYGRKIKKIKEFAQTPLGKKYINIMQSKGADTLSGVVMPSITEEIKKCGLPM